MTDWDRPVQEILKDNQDEIFSDVDNNHDSGVNILPHASSSEVSYCFQRVRYFAHAKKTQNVGPAHECRELIC